MNKQNAVLEAIETYFESIYTGNVDGLRRVFHPTAKVTDQVLGQFRERSAEEYIHAVASRTSPQALGESRSMNTLSIEVLDDVASVTARVDMLDQRYYNVLSLLREGEGWTIVHKLFGNVVS